MAYSDVEIEKIKAAVAQDAKGEDLFRLGLIYSTDHEDMGPDFVEAHKWFNLAAMMGSIPAKSYREELKREMSASDIMQALKAARSWLDEHRDMLTSQTPQRRFG